MCTQRAFVQQLLLESDVLEMMSYLRRSLAGLVSVSIFLLFFLLFLSASSMAFCCYFFFFFFEVVAHDQMIPRESAGLKFSKRCVLSAMVGDHDRCWLGLLQMAS